MNIQVSFRGMASSDALKNYAQEKIEKYSELLIPATKINIELTEKVSTKGVKNDFLVEINVSLPNVLIRVEEKGQEMYALIDKASDNLARNLKRYHEKKSNWDGVVPWSNIEAMNEDQIEDSEDDTYYNYTPKISSRKKMESMSPMSEAEAIERMELMGERQVLFKNSNGGLITMIYKDSKGRYCLIEPEQAL